MSALKKVDISGKKYPIKIDINVLERIQEEYGSVNQWERDLLGIRFVTNDDGEYVYDADGNRMVKKVEPSIRAIKIGLILAIQEGVEIEVEENGKAFEEVDEKNLFRTCDVSYEYLSELLHEEFKRCFAVKKPYPRETRRRKSQ